MHGVEHLYPKLHLAAQHGVGRTFHRKSKARHGAVLAQRHNAVGQGLVHQAKFPQHVVDSSGIKLLVAREEFFVRNGKGFSRNIFPFLNDLFQIHHPDFFFVLLNAVLGSFHFLFNRLIVELMFIC